LGMAYGCTQRSQPMGLYKPCPYWNGMEWNGMEWTPALTMTIID